MRERFNFQEGYPNDQGNSAGDFSWADMDLEDFSLLAVGVILLFALSLSAVGFLFL